MSIFTLETFFSPVVRLEAIRVSIVILSSLHFHIEQVEILKVFFGWKDWFSSVGPGMLSKIREGSVCLLKR